MKRLWIAFLVLVSLAPAALGQAKDFPNRPVRMIVTSPVGTSGDAIGRFFAQRLAEILGQPVVVDNRPGGDGVIGIAAVKQAPADGYTLLLATISPMSVNPIVMKNLPYDPVKDLKPVHGLVIGMNALVVPTDSKFNSLADLVAAAKKAEGALNFGYSFPGVRISAEWLASLAGVKFNFVPYKGTGQVLTDLIGHSLDVGMLDFGVASSLISAGKIKALAVGGKTRFVDSPRLPTIAESGYPGYTSASWVALAVRSDTPDDVVARFTEATKKILATDAAREFEKKYFLQALPLGPEEMRKFHLEELERFRRTAEAAGITPQ